MLSVWDPFADLNRMHRDLERNFFGSRGKPADFAPTVDVFEDEDALVLKAELPGVRRDDIDIQIDANVLTVKGERRLEEEETQNRRYHRVERSYGSFVRQFQLPTNVDAQAIEAALEEGILTLRLPKKAELKTRKIEVRGNGH